MPAPQSSNRFLLLLLSGLVLVAVAVAGWWIWSQPANTAAPAASPTPFVAATATPTATPLPAATATIPATVTPTATLAVTPTRPIAATPGPTVAPDLALELSAVQPNQYLGTIAARYGVSVDDLVAFSGIENPDVLAIGQGLVIPHRTDLTTPDQPLLPDSELVYGIGYDDFDIAAFVEEQGGYLSTYRAPRLDGGEWTGAELVGRIAERYSVGPRVLLAFMEAFGGWVTDPGPQGLALDYPLGHTNGAPGLVPQLEWVANELNHGFYGWQDRGETAIRFEDGSIARGAPGLNPGSIAVQWALAGDVSYDQLEPATEAFLEAYRRLFGDPLALDAGPVLPAGLEQPELQLPWPEDEWWHLTGGPHGGWISTSGWAALDFVPETAGIGTCLPAPDWAVAAAPGVVARTRTGEVMLDLDGDGDLRTGWVLQYLHLADIAVEEGHRLEAGDPIGRPSCEGGAAETTHLHFARLYNGLWVDAGGPIPMELDGWRAYGTFEYEGGMSKPGMPSREASHSRDREVNGLSW